MDKASPELHRGLDRFREFVLEDDRRLQRLQQTGDLGSFLALSVELGQAHGCVFSPQEMRELVQTERRALAGRDLSAARGPKKSAGSVSPDLLAIVGQSLNCNLN